LDRCDSMTYISSNGGTKIMSLDLMIMFECIENCEVNSDISKYYI